jgi:uncharacterized phiE125 gp8 family phage protein
MTAALITPPALEPVSLADAKLHMRIDSDDDDALIIAAIVAARVHVESTSRRRLITQGWRVYLDRWPRGRTLNIPVAPLQSVDEVRVFDAAGVATVVDPGLYAVDTASVPGRVVLTAGPPAAGAAANGIEIDVTAGYGATSIDVPTPLRQAIMMLVAHWYEHRGAVGHDQAGDVPPLGYDALVAPYRVLSL